MSRSVRREALDAFFLTNKFTFTCLYELVRFTSSFKASSSKIQHIRIFERVDDYPNSDFRVKGIQKARQRLRALKHLELYVFLSTWSAYETLHEDGLVNQLMHFALGPPPVVPSIDMQQTRKRKSEEVEAVDEDSVRKAAKVEDSTAPSMANTEKVDQAGPSTDTTSEEQVSPQTSSLTTSELSTPRGQEDIRAKRLLNVASAHRGEEALKSFLDNTSAATLKSTRDFLRLAPPTSLTSPPQPAPQPTINTPFLIPPLKSFNSTVRLRNLQLSLRTRPDTAKAEYYASLYTRLTDHLTDVFLDNGRRYRVVEDIPSLGPKPKLKVRDDEKMLVGVEKRGILYLKD